MNYLIRTAGYIAIGWASLMASAYSADESFNSAALGVYQDPGYAMNHDYSTEGSGDVIDPFSGALKIITTDLSIPGNGGLDINVVRNYQSVTNNVKGPYSNGRSARTPYGTGWDLNFGRILVSQTFAYLNQNNNSTNCKIPIVGGVVGISTALNPILELPDGTRETLVNADSTHPLDAFVTKGGWVGRCLPTAQNQQQGGLIVFSPQGLKYTFNLIGTTGPDLQLKAYFVTRIEDASGNYLDFTYNKPAANIYGPHHVLTQIKASDGRVVNFNYSDISGTQVLLTSITGAGKTVQYTYVNALSNIGPKAQYLSKVTYPDNTNWTYTYNDQASAVGSLPGRYSMATMKSPRGLSTSYQYAYQQMTLDPSESAKLNVIAKKTLANVRGSTVSDHVWTYQYVKGGFKVNDETLVTGPTSCTRYSHVGDGTVGTGAISNVNQGVWTIGLLKAKQILAKSGNGCGSVVSSETYDWFSQRISDQKEVRRYNLLVDSSTGRPIISVLTVTQSGKTHTTTTKRFDTSGNITEYVESGDKTRTITKGFAQNSNWPTWWYASAPIFQATSDIPDRIIFSYDNRGRVTGTSKYGVNTTYTYDAKGNIETKTDANYQTTFYSDYYRGVPRSERYPDDGVLTREVNTTGTVASMTDPLGRKTTYTYDSMDRLATILPPKGTASQTNLSYSFTNTNVLETLTRGAYSRAREYNQLGQLIKQTESGTGVTPVVSAATYTPRGQQAFVANFNYTVAASIGESFTYDALDRPLTNTHADGSKVTYAYGANTVTTTDERSNVTTNTYSSFGEPNNEQLVTVVQPGGGIQTLTTDNIGRVTAVSLGDLTRSYNYDSRGFLISEVNPETGTTVYTRDNVGNMLSKTVGSSATDTYYYDSRNRLVNTTFGGIKDRTNTYDLGGRLLSQSYDGTSRVYTYDDHDMLTSEKLKVSDPVRSYTVTYAYNAVDSLVSMTYPSGKIIEYAPDVFGRATKAGLYASAASYYPAGTLNTLKFGSGAALNISEDSRLRPTQRLVNRADGSVLMQEKYAYDVANNVTSITDSVKSDNSESMTYDGLNRLVGASHGVYSYNVRGDLVTNHHFGQNYDHVYDALGRLSKINYYAPQITYDAKGNILKAHGVYTYDAASNMATLCYKAERPNCDARPDQSFAYDGAGQRVSQKFNAWASRNDTKNQQVISFYSTDGKLLIEESLPSKLLNEYIYLGVERIAATSAVDTRFYHNDLLGSPSAFSGDGLTFSTNFRPFGERKEGAPLLMVNGENVIDGLDWPVWCTSNGGCTGDVEKVFGRIGYTGHVQDSDSGLIYAGARYLDPVMGRFLQADPVAVQALRPETFNRYNYANNNPYKYVDPTGGDPRVVGLPLVAYGAFVSVAAGGIAKGLQDGLRGHIDFSGAYTVDPALAAAGLVVFNARWNALLNENAADTSTEADSSGSLAKPRTGPGTVPKGERDPKRFFNPGKREAKRAEQGNKCGNGCGTDIDQSNSDGHHEVRHADGGRTTPDNHVEVCKDCHRELHNGQ